MIPDEERDRLVTVCRKMHEEGTDTEEILRFLRESKCSKGASLGVMHRALGLRPNEAKRLVHLSRTWADRRESDEKVENLFFDLLDEIADKIVIVKRDLPDEER